MNGKCVLAIGIVVACSMGIPVLGQTRPPSTEGQQSATGTARSVGTVKSINGNTLVLKEESEAAPPLA